MSIQVFNCSYQVIKKILPFVIHTINETNILHHPLVALIVNGFSISIEVVNLKYWSSKTNSLLLAHILNYYVFLGLQFLLQESIARPYANIVALRCAFMHIDKMLWPLHASFFVMKHGSSHSQPPLCLRKDHISCNSVVKDLSF